MVEKLIVSEDNAGAIKILNTILKLNPPNAAQYQQVLDQLLNPQDWNTAVFQNLCINANTAVSIPGRKRAEGDQIRAKTRNLFKQNLAMRHGAISGDSRQPLNHFLGWFSVIKP